MKKEDKITLHARERALERYGVVLSTGDVLELAQKLKPYAEKAVGTTSEDGSIRVVHRRDTLFPPEVHMTIRHKENEFYVHYSPVIGRIITFFDPFGTRNRKKRSPA